MTFSSDHMLFTWSGHFTAGNSEVMDDFAGGLRFTGPGTGSVQTEEILDDLIETFRGWIADGRAGIPTAARFDHFKWNRIGTDGRYVDRNNTLEKTPIPDAPGGLTSRYPTQVACATTWTTDFARGRASKGRTFWPTALEVNASSRFRLTPAFALGMAQWGVGFIRAMNQAASGNGPLVPVPGQPDPVPGDPATMVASVMSDIGTGRTAAINGCRVGDRLDIQRRRGNRVAEIYQSATF